MIKWGISHVGEYPILLSSLFEKRNGEILLFLYGASAILGWPCHSLKRGRNSLSNLGIFFPASFSNNNGIVAHLRCLFNPYLAWVEKEELFIEGFFSTCCHLKKVRDRQAWVGNGNGGLFLVAWSLPLPPASGPLYGLHTKRKTSHKGSTQAAYKAEQVINGVRGPVGNELGTSFSRMMQNITREGCLQMQESIAR